MFLLSARNIGECVSARGPEDTFDGSAQDKYLCDVDINKGPGGWSGRRSDWSACAM